MAIKIANNQALYCESAVVDAFPFSAACKFQVRTNWANHPLMWIGDKDQPDYFVDMQARGGATGDPVRVFVAKDGAANYQNAMKGPYTAETWHHGVGVLASTTSRFAYLDGLAGDEGTGLSAAPSGWNRTSLGALLDSTPTFFNWQILAELAFWNRVLKAWEAAALAKNWSPLFFLDGLVSYYPLGGRFGENYRDIVGGHDLSEWAGSALEWVDHPEGIIYPDDPEVGEYRVQEGPYEVAAGELFHTGAEAGEVFHSGAEAGQING